MPSTRTLPKELVEKLRTGGLRSTPAVCKQLLTPELDVLRVRLDSQRTFLLGKAALVYSFDTFIILKISMLCSNALYGFKIHLEKRSLSMVQFAVPWSPGFYPDPIDKHISNFSSNLLSDIEKQAVCLKFCAPAPVPLRQPVVDAEFESFFQQLKGLQPVESAVPKLKA